MKQQFLLGAVVAALTLSGCANSTSKATPERLAALRDAGLDQKAGEKLDKRLAKTLARGQKNGDLEGQFADLGQEEGADLATLVAAALDRNPRIGAAAQNINLADAQRMNAIFGYLPQVRFVLDHSNIQQSVIDSDNEVFQLGEAEYPVQSMQLRLEQPIFDLARIFGIQHAGNARSLSEVEYIRTVRDVSYEVLDTYLVASQARTRSQLLRRRMALMSRQIDSQDVLDETGLGDLVKSASLSSERSTLAAEEAMAAAEYAEALGTLARLTGQRIDEVPRITMPRGLVGAERKMSADDAVALGLKENPLMMAAALTAVGAELERRTAIADDFSPVLMAYASMKQEDRADSRFGGGSLTEDTTMGISLTIPLFNAAGEGYAMLPATVQARAATLDYHARQRELETNIRATHQRMGELRKALSQSTRASSAAARAFRTEKLRFDNGQSAEIAVAARELRYAVTRERVAYYQVEYIRAWARLQYLAGADLSKAEL